MEEVTEREFQQHFTQLSDLPLASAHFLSYNVSDQDLSRSEEGK